MDISIFNICRCSHRSQPGYKQPPITPANVEARVEAPFHAHTKLDTVETLMQPRNKPTTRREEVEATRVQAAAPPQPLAPTLLPYTEDDLLPGVRQQRDAAAAFAGRAPARPALPSGGPPPYSATAGIGRVGAYDDGDEDDYDDERDYVNVDTRRSPANSLERLDEANSSARPLVSAAGRAAPSTQAKPPRSGGRRSDDARAAEAAHLIPLSDMPTDTEYVNTLVERPPPNNGRSRPGGQSAAAQTRI